MIIRILAEERKKPIEDREFSWVIPQTGGFHFEMNLTKDIYCHFHEFVFEEFSFYTNHLCNLAEVSQKKCSDRAKYDGAYHISLQTRSKYRCHRGKLQ
jgi:hypothetical protein